MSFNTTITVAPFSMAKTASTVNVSSPPFSRHGTTAVQAVAPSTFTKGKLEGLFADELARLQPRRGYMRLPKESVLRIWKARKASVREEIANAERTAKAIQDKLDRLDEAFLFDRSITIDTYDRRAEKLREELTLVRIERHSCQLDELDVEGILAFAERLLPRAELTSKTPGMG